MAYNERLETAQVDAQQDFINAVIAARTAREELDAAKQRHNQALDRLESTRLALGETSEAIEEALRQ